MKATIVTAPTLYPVGLPEAKLHLRITHADDDAYITSLIIAAVDYVEQYIRRRLITQTWKYFLEDWPDDDAFELPFGQLQSVTSLKYKDEDGSESTVAAADYIVDTDSEPGRIVLAYDETWPTDTLYPSNPIYAQFVCGYGDEANDIPMPIRHAIKIKIADMYEMREPFLVGTIHTTLDTVDNLLGPYRLWLNG